MRIGAERRHHAPVGDVVHRVGDRIEEIDHAEKRDEAPALQARVEREIHNDGRGEDADHEPRLELAVARAGALDDVAHDGVVERVEHTRADHDRRHRAELRGGEMACKQDIREYEVGEQVIDHIPSDRAEGEHPEIAFIRCHVFHVSSSFSRTVRYSGVFSARYRGSCQARRRDGGGHTARASARRPPAIWRRAPAARTSPRARSCAARG